VLVGAPLVMASVVGARSNGAVDNASGVAAVLDAAERLAPHANVGVLLPSAEELGLAGARAWVRGRAPATALNCDGVDDHGELTIMYSGTAPRALLDTLRHVVETPLRVRRMPLGLLTDSVAFAGRGWAAVTVSRGSFATLRRVHTPHDSLANLQGDGIDAAADLLARAAEALAR
jgi:Zn-dependent M28 family amino/carboxypeptidase